MISAVRDSVLALACIRHGLPAVHGRGLDLLPGEVTAPFEKTLIRELSINELTRAFQVAIDLLTEEIRRADQGLAERLHDALAMLSETSP